METSESLTALAPGPDPGRSQRVCARVWRRVAAGLAAVWLAVFLLGLGLAAWLFDVLVNTGLAAGTLTAVAWLMFLAVAAGSAAGLARTCRGGRLLPLVKANMLELFPGQRQDLDVWFATRLHCANEAAVFGLVGRRLDRDLPARWRNRLVRVPWLTLAGLLAAGVLGIAGAWLSAGSPLALMQRYLQRLFLGHNNAPLTVQALLPERRWTVAGEPVAVEVVFDRPVEGAVTVEFLGPDAPVPVALSRLSGRQHRGVLPGATADFSWQVHAEQLRTEPLAFRVLPKTPVRLTQADVYGLTGQRDRILRPADFPATVPEGVRVVFNLELAAGPWRDRFGIRGRVAGELPVVAHTDVAYTATVTVRQDDSFSLFWLLPDSGIRQSPAVALKCQPDQPPQVAITEPADGTVFAQEPGTLTIRATGRDDNGVARAWLYVTDYFACTYQRELPLAKGAWDRVQAEATLTLADLGPREGRVLGICVAMADNAVNRKVTFAEPVNLVVPARDLAPVNREAQREFWERIVKQTTNPERVTGDPLAKLQELVSARPPPPPPPPPPPDAGAQYLAANENQPGEAKPIDQPAPGEATPPTAGQSVAQPAKPSQTPGQGTRKPALPGGQQGNAGEAPVGPSQPTPGPAEESALDDDDAAQSPANAGGGQASGQGGQRQPSQAGSARNPSQGQQAGAGQGQGQQGSGAGGQQQAGAGQGQGQQGGGASGQQQAGAGQGQGQGQQGSGAGGQQQAGAGQGQGQQGSGAGGQQQAGAGQGQGQQGSGASGQQQAGAGQGQGQQGSGSTGGGAGQGQQAGAGQGQGQGQQGSGSTGGGAGQGQQGSGAGGQQQAGAGQGQQSGGASGQQQAGAGQGQQGSGAGGQQQAGAGQGQGQQGSGAGGQQQAGAGQGQGQQGRGTGGQQQTGAGQGQGQQGSGAGQGQGQQGSGAGQGQGQQGRGAGGQQQAGTGQGQSQQGSGSTGDGGGQRAGGTGGGQRDPGRVAPAAGLPLPPAHPKPPTKIKPDDDRDRYQAERDVELTAGTKADAKRVEGPPLDVNREGPAGPNQPSVEPPREDLHPADAKPTRPLDPALLAALAPAAEAGGGLSPSERDKALATYDELLKRLPPAERQKLREYYRLLRDIH